MADDPLDLSLLDPTRDEARFHRRVGTIVRDGLAERQRDLFVVLDGWMRPALVAAAVVIVFSLLSVLRPPLPRSATTAEVLGIPQEIVDLATSSRQASLDDIADALDTGASYAR